MKILVAIDGSSYTKHMLAWLAVHGEMLGKNNVYEMLTVLPEFPRYAPVMDLLDPRAMREEMSEQVFHPVREFAIQQGWDCNFKYQVGDPGKCIAWEATDGKFDLLLLGSHGHTALGNVVLGSVATNALARCKVPVLIIR